MQKEKKSIREQEVTVEELEQQISLLQKELAVKKIQPEIRNHARFNECVELADELLNPVTHFSSFVFKISRNIKATFEMDTHEIWGNFGGTVVIEIEGREKREIPSDNGLSESVMDMIYQTQNIAEDEIMSEKEKEFDRLWSMIKEIEKDSKVDGEDIFDAICEIANA